LLIQLNILSIINCFFAILQNHSRTTKLYILHLPKPPLPKGKNLKASQTLQLSKFRLLF
jgi:hypothetical protein